MFYFIFAVHILLCISLIGLVLLQQGKGADMGAAFGGGSNTLFGASGATAFITKLTTGIALTFMATSILLVNMYSSYARSGAALGSTTNAVDSIMGGGQPKAVVSVVPPQGAQDAAAAADVNPVAPAAVVPAQPADVAPVPAAQPETK